MNLLGKRFGSLTVIGREETITKGNTNYPQWKCRCDCGNIITVKQKDLRSGDKTHCGCKKKSNVIDLAGMRFGNLTVVRRDHGDENARNKGAWWLCNCDCGNSIVVRGDYLRYGKRTNCGCGCTGNERPHKMKRRAPATITYNGVTKTIAEWGRITGLSRKVIAKRINVLKWDTERALETPVASNKKERIERGYVSLAMAIIQQAAYDFRDLRNERELKLGDRNEGFYSKDEIEEFFKGKWCSALLANSNCIPNGRRLLRILKEEDPYIARQYVDQAKVKLHA